MKKASPLRCFLIIILTFFVSGLQAQDHYDDQEYAYDELYVLLTIENIGYYEIDALYADDQLYLPVVDLFNKLKIYVTHSSRLDTIRGYLGNPENAFELNTVSGQASFMDKIFPLSSQEYIATYNDLFLPLSLYEKLFGFNFHFDFRSLTVLLQSDIELPIVKLLRIERMRENLKALKGEVKVDTTLQRKYHVLGGAVIDWNLSMTQGSHKRPIYSLRLDAGAELLGGELDIKTHFGNQADFNYKEQSATWRFVRNQSKIVRQVDLGIISAPLISQANASLLGFRLTNTPKAYRKSYGVYVLQKKSLPGWEIELYVNNVLIDFTTADANGEFTFEVPLIYGNSSVVLKYYGPWGEEKIEEQIINIPYMFVPKKTLEYQIYSGMTFDSLENKFAHAGISYGLGRRATISAGYETFERNISSRHIPFVNASGIIFKNTLLSYTFAMNAYHKASFLIRTKGSLSFEGDYTYYDENQDALLVSNRSEATLGLNLPFKIKKTGGYFKSYYRLNQTLAGQAHFIENNLSIFYKRLNFGIVSNISVFKTQTATLGVNASLSLPRQWTLYAYTFMDIDEAELDYFRFQMQKKFGRYIFSNLTWNYGMEDRSSYVSLSVYFDLKILRGSMEAVYDMEDIRTSQTLSGSTVLNTGRHPVSNYSYPNQGKGIIDVIVFLDINHNNKKDKNEPLISEASVGMSKGLKVSTAKDSISRFISLEPYTQYIVTLGKTSFESISWIPAYTVLAVYPDPNQVKKVFIPVHPMGEIEGRIMIANEANVLQPAAKIVMEITDENNEIVGRTLSEFDGYFYYLGLKPGKYKVSPSSDQLKNLGFRQVRYAVDFEVKQSEEGDFISDIEIILN